MPEYLAPGVYVEEVSFRAKSIEGVSTSTAGFVGPTRYGPTEGEPELLTSFADFERIYGGIDRLKFDNESDETENYIAHAVRAFFDNGGSRLYVSRVYSPAGAQPFSGHSSLPNGSPADITLRARFPGEAGDMRIIFAVKPSGNLLTGTVPNQVVRGVHEHDVVYIHTVADGGGTDIEGFYDVEGEGAAVRFSIQTRTTVNLSSLQPNQYTIHLVRLTVRVRKPGRFADEQVWTDLSLHPAHRSAVQSLFTHVPNTRNQYLTIPFAIESRPELWRRIRRCIC